MGEGSAANDTSDPLDQGVSRLLATGSSRHDLGACLATLGVSHILLPKQADWASYSFLSSQHDLVLERRWSDLLLYRNTHPTSLAQQVDRSAASPCNTRVTPLPAKLVNPGRIELARPVPRGDLVALAVSPGPNWKMNGDPGRLLTGVIPVFRIASGTTTFVASTSKIVRRNELIGIIALLSIGVLKAFLATIEWIGRRQSDRRRHAAEISAGSPEAGGRGRTVQLHAQSGDTTQ